MPSGTPAPGYRERATGTLRLVDNEGSVWSASTSGTTDVYLYFSVTGLNPSYAGHCGNGFPLRCLSE